MEHLPEAKSARMLAVYTRLMAGQVLNKRTLALEYGITERSVQRDMESLRCFLTEQNLPQDVIYDRRERATAWSTAYPKG